MKGVLYFSECKHNGDLDEYISDIIKCGGKVLSKGINYEAERGKVEVEFDETFAEQFRKTRACESSNMAN